MTRWMVVVGGIALISTLIYVFMAYRVSEREAECKERCAASGAKTYSYTAPATAGRRVGLDSCECIR